VQFDLNRAYSMIEGLLDAGNIIVRYSDVDVNGCAQRCFARANDVQPCTSFLVSRDGTGKCYLLSSRVSKGDY